MVSSIAPPSLLPSLPPSDGLFVVGVSQQGNLVGSGLAFAVMVGTVQSILSKATKVRYVLHRKEWKLVRFDSVRRSSRFGRYGSEPNEARKNVIIFSLYWSLICWAVDPNESREKHRGKNCNAIRSLWIRVRSGENAIVLRNIGIWFGRCT